MGFHDEEAARYRERAAELAVQAERLRVEAAAEAAKQQVRDEIARQAGPQSVTLAAYQAMTGRERGLHLARGGKVTD